MAAPLAAGAADLESRIKIHGFLSQAWAKTDGEKYLGITEDGTTDYRNLALQFRFQLAERQSLVFQLGHESRGESPRDAFRDDVEIDWAFYEAELGKFTVRVGRIPLPLGIYGELRDAGHLLPFYGPPVTIYGETNFASESIEGGSVSFGFFHDSPWSLELDLFAGESEFSERSRATGVRLAETRSDWGARLWLNTPVEGLRLGLNHHSFETTDSAVLLNRAGHTVDYLSFDMSRDRWLLRSEFGKGDIELPFAEAEVTIGYLTAGFSPLPKFWVYLQGEQRHTSLTPRLAPARTGHKSLGISLTYAISERAVIKLEHQNLDTNDLDRIVAGFERPEVQATIASISVAY